MFHKKTIADIDPKGKRVLVRVDFNVPLDGEKVADDTRIQAALPTIKYLLDHGATVILSSHLGRPGGKVNPDFSLRPVAEHLDTLIDASVSFVEDCIGPDAKKAASALQSGQILVLENTRFHAGEKDNDPDMARALASLADLYVNDAFGSAHRAHASTEGVAHFLPAVAGFLMEKEIRYLGTALSDPKRPFVAILGGVKVSDKIEVIQNLLAKADQILIGGGMANTFFKAQDLEMGDSLVEEDSIEMAKDLLSIGGSKLHLPTDFLIANRLAAEAEHLSMPIGDVPAGWMVVDIGPESITIFSSAIAEAGTVVWNGPMGVFEIAPFASGTFALAEAMSTSKAETIVGGGDTAAALQQSGSTGKITHISTGGSASLDFLAGKTLPGLAALQDKE